MSDFGIRVPVGLPGEQRYTSLMVESDESVSRIWATSSVKFSWILRGTWTTETSLICADTPYMPYVGGHVRILSLPGTQKQRRRLSIASSDPTPTNKLSGVSVLSVCVLPFRRLHNRRFSSCWCLNKDLGKRTFSQ